MEVARMLHRRFVTFALLLFFGLVAVRAEASLIDSQWGYVNLPQPPVQNTPFISVNFAVYDRGADGGTDWTGNADINNMVSQWAGTAGRYLYLYTVGRGSGNLAPDVTSFTINGVTDVATYGTTSGTTAFTKNGYGFIMSSQAQGQFAPLTVEPSTSNFAHNKNLQTTTASWVPGSITGTFNGGLGHGKTQSQFFGYTSNTPPGPVDGLPIPAVPEPASLALFGLGIALCSVYPFRRRTATV
jgi:hypothetical protein